MKFGDCVKKLKSKWDLGNMMKQTLKILRFDYDIIRFRFFGLRNRKIYETFFKKE